MVPSARVAQLVDERRPQRFGGGRGARGVRVRHPDVGAGRDLLGQRGPALAGLALAERCEPEVAVVADRLAVAQQHHLVSRVTATTLRRPVPSRDRRVPPCGTGTSGDVVPGSGGGVRSRAGVGRRQHVKIGLHIADFTYPAGGPGLADDLTRIVVAAEEAGFAARQRDGPPVGRSRCSGRPSTRCSRPTRRSATSPRARREGRAARVGDRRQSTATPACSPRSSPRSTCSPRAAPGSASAPRGTSEEAEGLGLFFPRHRRALRAARGDAADLPADVERRRRARTTASTTGSGAR